MFSEVMTTIKKFVPEMAKNAIRNFIIPTVALLKVPSLLKNIPDVRLEIGAGQKKGTNGWITLDRTFKSDLYWDLLKKMPFPDNSIAMIYSSHVLEHFSYRELIRLLKDCFRILKPGGEFSACVPDARGYVFGYMDPDSFNRNHMGAANHAIYSDLKMDILNYIAYMDGEHKYMFDDENLLHILKEVGFVSASIREFDSKLDLTERKYLSIYVSCYKSGGNQNRPIPSD